MATPGSNTILQETKPDQTTPLYKYQKLPDHGFIRILKLSRTRTDALECSLEHIEVINAEYEALSYEWGPSSQIYSIYARDQTESIIGVIPLTVNLFHALRDLRDSTEVQTTHFWIDQICINQNDEEEKASQVAMMADVYSNASRVITYLGPHSSNMATEEGALALLQEIYQRCQPYLWEILSTYPFTANSSLYLQSLLDTFNTIPLNRAHWTALVQIVYSGWTHRLWMVQEGLLCPNTVMLRGHRILDWFSAATFPVLIEMDILRLEMFDESSLSFDVVHRHLLVCDAAVARWQWRLQTIAQGGDKLPLMNLNDLLPIFSGLGCSDPRDYVYAMLGISKDAKTLGVVPNYKISSLELFKQVSVRIYQESHNLSLLSITGAFGKPSNTLVPTWAYHPGPRVEGFLRVKSAGHPSQVSDTRFEADNAVMVVRGSVVDDIIRVIPPPPFHEGTSSYQIRFPPKENSMRTLQIAAMLLCPASLNLKAVTSLFFIWTHGERLPDDKDDVDICFSVWCVLISNAAWLAKDHPDILNESWFTDDFMPVLSALSELLKGWGRHVHHDVTVGVQSPYSEIASEVESKCSDWGRAYCQTARGHLCNSTGRTREGDVIALLAGGVHAYVLRPADNGAYQYIGTAYVHGLMQGEFYAESSPDELDYDIRLV